MSVWLCHSKSIASSRWGFQELDRDHRVLFYESIYHVDYYIILYEKETIS